MTVRNELSRFLQKNTFGPTDSELDALEAAFVALQSEPITRRLQDEGSSTNTTTSAATTITHAEAMA